MFPVAGPSGRADRVTEPPVVIARPGMEAVWSILTFPAALIVRVPVSRTPWSSRTPCRALMVRLRRPTSPLMTTAPPALIVRSSAPPLMLVTVPVMVRFPPVVIVRLPLMMSESS